MLNAFRHHGNSHVVVVAIAVELVGCSTPFGIMGILTGTRGATSSGPFVLNAFRHHGNSHPNSRRSTLRFLISAQRLSASWEFSPSRTVSSRTNSACSTPFGIMGILTVWCRDSMSFGIRAQRLSASWEFSPLLPRLKRRSV